MIKPYTTIKKCRSCNKKIFKKDFIFSIGKMAITGIFLKKKEKPKYKIPLDLYMCGDCKLVQLLNSTNPNLMFRDYWYESGINQTMTDHLNSVVSYVNNFKKFDNPKVLDIGANDGTLMEKFSRITKKKNIVGIDPAKKIFKKKGYKFVNDFFSKSILNKNKISNKFDIITSVAMFYDLENPNSFADDIKNSLSEEGIWFLELNYLGSLMKDYIIDTIAHEHVCYYSLTTLKKILDRNSLFINKVDFSTINGGSIRLIISKKKKNIKDVEKILIKEKKDGLNDFKKMKTIISRIKTIRDKLKKFILTENKRNKKIAILGASTRGNTIMQFCNLNYKNFIGASDRNKNKDGLYMNGTLIKIYSEQVIRDRKPDYFFVLPYFYIKELIKREMNLLKDGVKFIVPLPYPYLIYFKNGKIVKKII